MVKDFSKCVITHNMRCYLFLVITSDFSTSKSWECVTKCCEALRRMLEESTKLYPALSYTYRASGLFFVLKQSSQSFSCWSTANRRKQVALGSRLYFKETNATNAVGHVHVIYCTRSNGNTPMFYFLLAVLYYQHWISPEISFLP